MTNMTAQPTSTRKEMPKNLSMYRSRRWPLTPQPIAQQHDAVAMDFAVDQLQCALLNHAGKERDTCSKEHGVNLQHKLVNQARLAKRGGKVGAPTQPYVLAGLTAQTSDHFDSVLRDERDVRIGAGLHASRKDVAPEHGIRVRLTFSQPDVIRLAPHHTMSNDLYDSTKSATCSPSGRNPSN